MKSWKARVKLALVAVITLTQLQHVVYGQAVTTPRISAPVQSSDISTPEWLAWKVFYQSLIFYQKQSPSLVTQMLHAKFGLNASKTIAFSDAMNMFVTTTNAIDDRARSEAQSRFGPHIPLRTKQNLPIPASLASPFFSRLAKQASSIRSKTKSAVFSAHLTGLGNLITAEEIAAMTAWVHGSVAPRITTVQSEAPRRGGSTTK